MFAHLKFGMIYTFFLVWFVCFHRLKSERSGGGSLLESPKSQVVVVLSYSIIWCFCIDFSLGFFFSLPRDNLFFTFFTNLSDTFDLMNISLILNRLTISLG